MEAVTTALRELFADQKAAMREVVGGLSAEALNWAPAGGEETNSIAQMLSHALDAERFLVAAAAGVTLDRDREAHFAIEIGSADEILDEIDRTAELVNGWLEQLSADKLAAVASLRGSSRSGAWLAIHALEHAREHIGQALLTRQLYEAGQR